METGIFSSAMQSVAGLSTDLHVFLYGTPAPQVQTQNVNYASYSNLLILAGVGLLAYIVIKRL